MKGSGLLVLVLAGCGLMGLLISTAEAASSHEYGVNNQRDFRSRRGFKTIGLATARGFGKRTVLPAYSTTSSLPPSASFTYDDSEQHHQQALPDDHPGNEDLETYPIDWLVSYLQKKPSVLRYLVERLLDRNGDGMVTASEIISSLHTN